MKRKENRTNQAKEDYRKSLNSLRSMQEKQTKVFSLIAQIQMAKGLVELNGIINEAAARYKITKEETENIISVLLRDETIYEPKVGCYRIT
jgi:DNA replicative helicase MCM subunit Mcm2 (Cdc46/Mcm family)